MVMTSTGPVERSLRGTAAARGALAGGAIAVCLVACATRGGDLEMPGVSTAVPQAQEHGRAMPSGSAQPWDRAAELASLVAIDDRPLPSRGHNPPYWTGVVRVSPQLEAVYRAPTPSSSAPRGAIAIEAHTTTTGATGPVYAMTKRDPGFDPRGGDWEDLVLDDDGNVESRGILPLCARCHGDAPYDHLFGPRAEARKQEPGSPPPDAGPRDEDEGRAPTDADLPPGTTKPSARPGKKRRGH